MKNSFRSLHASILVILLCIGFIVVSCTSEEKPSYPLSPEALKKGLAAISKTGKKPEKPPVVRLNPSASGRKSIKAPAELYNLIKYANDIQYELIAENWARASTRLLRLESNWMVYGSKDVLPGITTAQLDGTSKNISILRQEISAKRWYEGALAANRVALSAAILIKSYNTSVPFELNKLSYDLHQVLLTSQHGSWMQAQNEYSSTVLAWDAVVNDGSGINKYYRNQFSDGLEKLRLSVFDMKKDKARNDVVRLLSLLDYIRKDYEKK